MAKKVLLVTDEESGDEAIYIDGKKVYEETTLYAVDIAEAIKGMEVTVEHHTIHLLDHGVEFPANAEDLMYELPEFPIAPTVGE